jgi:hypothetical protein
MGTFFLGGGGFLALGGVPRSTGTTLESIDIAAGSP